MAIGDIWELTLRGTFLSQEVLNVFNYRETVALGGDAAPEDIGAWFWDTFSNEILNAISSSVTFTQVDIFQVTGGTGIGTYAITGGAGLAPGEPLPSSTAYGFRYNRASSDSRHGYKRFPGVVEGAVNGNTTVGSYLTSLNDTTDDLEADIFDASSVIDGRLEPVILSRVVNGAERPVPIAFPVSSVVYTGVTTQNTRKP